MKLNVEIRGTEEQVQAVVANEGMSKSAKIKELFNLGLEVKEISLVSGIVYNMCYNVITNYVITNGLEVVKEKKVSKKDLVWEMFDKGMNNMMVAKETQTNYNYICKLRKEWKMVNTPEEVVEEVFEATGTDATEVSAEVAATVIEEVVEKAPIVDPLGRTSKRKGGKK